MHVVFAQGGVIDDIKLFSLSGNCMCFFDLELPENLHVTLDRRSTDLERNPNPDSQKKTETHTKHMIHPRPRSLQGVHTGLEKAQLEEWNRIE